MDLDKPSRGVEWNDLFNLGAMILAVLEAPEYAPREEWMDEDGFCWMGGFHKAKTTYAMAKKMIDRFGLRVP